MSIELILLWAFTIFVLLGGVIAIIIGKSIDDDICVGGIMVIIGSILSMWLLSQIEEPFDAAWGFIAICVVQIIFSLKLFFAIHSYKGNNLRIKAKQNSAVALSEQQKAFTHIVGVEKIHKQLEQEAADKKAGINALRKFSNHLLLSTYQSRKKEKDWAILGGIAQGIAGPVAGIAVATTTMAHNEEIRQTNENNLRWAAQQSNEMNFAASELEKEDFSVPTIDQLNAQYEICRNISPNLLFSKLNIETQSIDIDNTSKSATVYAKWESLDNELCVDGHIRANFYTNTNCFVGSASLSLPTFGTFKASGVMDGICLIDEYSKPCTVKYEPIDLWVISKKFSNKKDVNQKNV